MKTQEMHGTREGLRPTRSEVDDFLRTQKLCALATLDEAGRPQIATVAFSVTEQGGSYLVGTSVTSRKSHNVDHNSDVAMVVTDPEQRITVQLEGTARKLGAEEFETVYADELYRQRPESLPFKDIPDQVHILITPTHVRYSDCNPHPWVLTEFEA